MKKLNKTIALFVLSIVLSNCASTKLTEAWSSKDFDDTKSKKLLVVARSTDLEVREAYENELVSELKEQGVNAVAAHVKFPNLKEDKNRSQEEIDDILSMFNKNGIKSIMLTALKDTREESSSAKSTTNYGTASIKGKYGVSFTDYYNVHSIEYISRGLKPVYNDNQDFGTPLSSTTYVLEAVLYDITLAKNEQLVGVFEIASTDPSSAKQILNKFKVLISKQFKR